MKLFGQLTRLMGVDTKESSQEKEEQENLIAHTLEMTDRRIAEISLFQENLWPAIQFARGYFHEVLKSIPGSFALDDGNMPLKDIFPTENDLTACLGRSIAVKAELPHHIHRQRERVFALLGVRLRPGRDGEIQMVDHTVRSLRSSPSAVCQALLDVSFDSLLQGFANQNLHYEKKLEQIRVQHELFNQSRASTYHAPTEAEDGSAVTPSFSKLEKEPKAILADLIDCLHSPASRLRLEFDNGYTLENAPGEEKNRRLPLMLTQDRRNWLACIVEFPVAMAQAAVSKETHNHRFILI